jgi:hypothetical protein
MGGRINIYIESDELLDALDDFVKGIPRLSRSEAVECMLFYVFSHEEHLEEVANVLDQSGEDEDEDLEEEEEEDLEEEEESEEED